MLFTRSYSLVCRARSCQRGRLRETARRYGIAVWAGTRRLDRWDPSAGPALASLRRFDTQAARLAAMLLAAAWTLAGCSGEHEQYPSASAAIVHVTVIDVESGSVRQDRTILIGGQRILAVVPSVDFQPPAGLRVADGAGKFAIPGLWDMHFHLVNDDPPYAWDLDVPADENQRQTYNPAWIAFGVTGAREMSGGPWSLKMRDRVESGEIDGPHLVIGSPILDGPYPIFPGSGVLAIANPEEARETVTRLHAEGYDFLKPYNFLSPESYRAITETAERLDMDVAGELPLSVSAWDAIAQGQRSIEHMTGIETACSSREVELRAKYAAGVAAIAANPELGNQVAIWNRAEWEPVESYDPAKCERLYREFVERGVWVTPTLAIQRRLSYPEITETGDNPYLKYLFPGDADISEAMEKFNPDRRLKPTYDSRFAAITELRKAGVGILAGSDMQGGFWVHEELRIFVDAGLTPLEALQTATLNPARYLGREHEMGSIADGKLADIVLLNANPLENIANTLDIDSVVLKGRLYDRAELDRMLAQLEVDAQPKKVGD